MKYISELFLECLRGLSIMALLLLALLPAQAQSTKMDFKLTVLNSIGEPQKNLYLQIKGYSSKFDIDEKGVIQFDAYMSKTYIRTAELFFKDNDANPVKSFTLKEDNRELVMYINSTSDLLRFKQENKPVEVEGILVDEEGEPVVGASVSLLGTGNHTKTDEIGLFHIVADYNHPLIIRARGMETRTMAVDAFIRNADEAMTVTLKSRNSDHIYNVAEEMPVYRGGMKYFAQYLNRAAAYPEEKQKSGIEGVVVVQFVVEKDGSISQPKIVRHLEPELDSIAFRAIELSPRWIPAKDAGRTVRCRYSMPVAFQIPKTEPVLPADSVKNRMGSLKVDSLIVDSLMTDSLKVDNVMADSLKSDSVRLKNLTDSISLRKDSLLNDSLRMDSVSQSVVKAEKKVKKRPCGFVRFFRRLFGIKRGDDMNTQEVSSAIEAGKDEDQTDKKRKRRKRKMEVPVVQDTVKVNEELPVHDMPAVPDNDTKTEENNTKNINL